MANRPLSFESYIGQERMKLQLRISIGASKRNNTALPHTLFSGNPGLGKTTIAKIIASELGVPFFEVMASNLNTAEDVERILAQLPDNAPAVLFIDEIHRLTLKIEELLYPVMEDFEFETDRLGKPERLWVPRFTLVGATTLAGDLSRPLRDRFGNQFVLQNYQIDEIGKIISVLAEREEVEVDTDAINEIAKRAKGVARIAVKFYHRCKEFADFIIGDGVVTGDVARQQFELMGIDEIGLDENDIKVLEYLATQVRPVGLDALSTGCDVDKPTIQNIIEPYLVQKGMINRTRSGREITERGKAWIGSGGVDAPITTRVENDTTRRRVGQ